MKDAATRPAVAQDVIRLYDEYTHQPLSRRVFLRRLVRLLGSSAAAYAVLPLLENNYAHADLIAPGDPRLQAGDVHFGSLGAAPLSGYLVQPQGQAAKSLPGVVVVHENRGLNPHICDVARRLALAGFLVLAPDYLSPQGGTPLNEDQARDMFDKLDAATTREVASQAFGYLRTAGNGRVGAVGFCWGGGQVGQMAVQLPDLAAAVLYYGNQPAAAEVGRIQAPLLLHYAGLDERINAGIPAFEAALKEAGTSYRLYVYPGVNHAFNNDTNAARYDQGAANLAWQRTLEFLHQYLSP
ncbi:dienelactone hydrolase family protein [Vogesella sp. LIG4]|uniref:dienelactone hydrolase family protein n=1 Tax=Vogesella sp. LIG4 TaxID=1192162 RepID=UPI00081FD04E|nr:dienelactone hydrolase family protein [Vogesella sp. LIG4]SCK22039.1 carboxymethylenebutenolidase [Vogesella sp. LIG4]